MPVPEKIDEDYLAYIRRHECIGGLMGSRGNCMTGRVEAHHIDGKGMGSSKRDDRLTVPLCLAHHREFHDSGHLGERSHLETILAFKADALRFLLAYMDQGEPSKIFHQPEEAF